ncbi:DUF481 domain-containing protein [Granulicella mallensis]|uniref:DUF481 domain-containing protein n=1 Tax=Granulicella mallensis TaxID=940614 RepID=A0A7W7ZTM1_9BACT|nr:DUF481 domain-containing protein [Granulicella mallensis]MBB5065860.1 hypothetical protein [Granulicella mallensis]
MRRFPVLFSAAILGLSGLIQAQAQTPAPKPTPDVLVFSNGDQLTGKLERVAGGNAVFKSDMAGELTISLDKVKELRSGEKFALLRKGIPVTKADAPTGTVDMAGGNVVLTNPGHEPDTVPTKDVNYLIDKDSFDRQIARKTKFLQGWNGTVTGGATVVRATDNGTTFTAAVNLIRTTPVVPYLPPDTRTTVNVAESYGKLTTPLIPPTDPPTPPSVAKTSIFHTDAEHDKYFSPRFYALADLSFDHNFSQGLQFQQVYGGGVGWTAIQKPKQQLDLKVDLHYETQQFIQQLGVPNVPSVNLIGSTFAETYHYNLPHGILFTETGDVLPGWNDMTAYSANGTATLALPVYKRLSASFSTTDNFLNNPPPFNKKNSYQFVTGVTYTLH